MAYYDDKVDDLRRLFGVDDIEVTAKSLRVGARSYDIVDDVIVVLHPDRRPSGPGGASVTFAPQIQRTFGAEWQAFWEILPEHKDEFVRYVDLLDLDGLSNALVCDLGCGMGRHSYFMAAWCRAIVLVDFSDAIFVARRNLREVPGAIFIMADIADLPFAPDCCDLVMSLGVLHHLPVDALGSVRSLRTLAPRLLIYLYYALDNRPSYFQPLLRLITAVRRKTARVTNSRARAAITSAVTYAVYLPLIALGVVARRIGVRTAVPLDAYRGKSIRRVRQDVYDRFFTSIEQRVTRQQIEELSRDFSVVSVSDDPPYWHFECVR